MSEIWEKINGLYFEYAEAINSYDRDRYANTFCKDAILESAGQPPSVGRETIRGKVNLEKFGLKWLFQIPPRFHILEHTEDSVRARAYTVEISNRNGEGTCYLAAYLDHCVIEDGSWRFKHRLGDILYHGAADLTAGRVLYPAPARF